MSLESCVRSSCRTLSTLQTRSASMARWDLLSLSKRCRAQSIHRRNIKACSSSRYLFVHFKLLLWVTYLGRIPVVKRIIFSIGSHVSSDNFSVAGWHPWCLWSSCIAVGWVVVWRADRWVLVPLFLTRRLPLFVLCLRPHHESLRGVHFIHNSRCHVFGDFLGNDFTYFTHLALPVIIDHEARGCLWFQHLRPVLLEQLPWGRCFLSHPGVHWTTHDPFGLLLSFPFLHLFRVIPQDQGLVLRRRKIAPNVCIEALATRIIVTFKIVHMGNVLDIWALVWNEL